MTIQERAVAGAGAAEQDPPTRAELARAGWGKTARAFVYAGETYALVALRGPHAENKAGCTKHFSGRTMGEAIELALDFCDGKQIRITQWSGNLQQENTNDD